MLSSHTRLSLILAASAFIAPAAISGCGSSSQAYTPASSATARESLDAALAAWQNGAKPEGISAGPTAVTAVDFQWRDGQPLERYEVLEELPAEGDHDKRFSARLKLKTAKAEQKVTYVLIGRDPVWVYRDEDYTRLLNMDNNPRPSRKAAGGSR
jgi:hypothetical protein